MPEQPLPRILPNGDTALTVEFRRNIDEIINRTVLALDRAVAAQSLPGIVETVPTYRSLLIHYDPLVVDFATLRERLLALASRPIVPVATSRRWRVPVVYGGEYGIDLDDVAKARGLTPDEIAARHIAGGLLCRHGRVHAGLRLPERSRSVAAHAAAAKSAAADPGRHHFASAACRPACSASPARAAGICWDAPRSGPINCSAIRFSCWNPAIA